MRMYIWVTLISLALGCAHLQANNIKKRPRPVHPTERN